MVHEPKRLQAPPELWDKLRPRAREMRHEPTPAEKRLWDVLRRMRPSGFKLRRQHAIGPYIVDFYCVQAALIIEVDGPIHNTSVEQDTARQQYLEASGLRVIRFTNDEVLQEIAHVERLIEAAASSP
ncbi:MAG TPA: endonuclease domain-containing protein [Dehalococcoidia bacterium]|nr:endonuclease domain-containing protein [Dehalococcoidia bacterium]